MYVYVYIYIYIYRERERERSLLSASPWRTWRASVTPITFPTKGKTPFRFGARTEASQG